jgi:hypothetical protein
MTAGRMRVAHQELYKHVIREQKGGWAGPVFYNYYWSANFHVILFSVMTAD